MTGRRLWKIIIPIALVLGFMTHNIWAGNGIINSYKSFVAAKNGYIIVNSYDGWLNEINRAKTNLKTKLLLCIENFDKEIYDLSKVSEYNISIKANGEVRGNRAYIDYTFEYSDNYVLLMTADNYALVGCLSQTQLWTYNKVKAIVTEITGENMTDYEKEKAIHDYIVSNYRYDSEGIENNTITVRSHSVTGLICDGKGVCEAYANTFMLMCKMAGVECSIATGNLNGVDHAWNIVKLDGEYYNVDVTNDDPLPDVAGRVRYTYFNLSDDEMTEYIVTNRKVEVCSGKKYNYYSYNGLVVSSYEELEALAARELSAGKRELTFKTENFILNSGTYIKRAVSNRGFSKMTVYGEFGTDNVYYVTLE